jgi:hypothetical protein
VLVPDVVDLLVKYLDTITFFRVTFAVSKLVLHRVSEVAGIQTVLERKFPPHVVEAAELQLIRKFSLHEIEEQNLVYNLKYFNWYFSNFFFL